MVRTEHVSFLSIKQNGTTRREEMCIGEGEGWSVAAFDGFQLVDSRVAQTELKFLLPEM
jgi:hypothetical protein